jgi:hypothetical protein
VPSQDGVGRIFNSAEGCFATRLGSPIRFGGRELKFEGIAGLAGFCIRHGATPGRQDIVPSANDFGDCPA